MTLEKDKSEEIPKSRLSTWMEKPYETFVIPKKEDYFKEKKDSVSESDDSAFQNKNNFNNDYLKETPNLVESSYKNKDTENNENYRSEIKNTNDKKQTKKKTNIKFGFVEILFLVDLC